MTDTAHPNPMLQLPEDIFYVETSLRPGLTISEYRRSRPRLSFWQRLRRAGR